MAPSLQIDRKTVLDHCRPRYGTTNPEIVESPFFAWSIHHEMDPYTVRNAFKIPTRKDRCVNTAHSQYRDLNDGPLWTFARFGMSQTRLTNGATLYIAGEHEDWYDPDFCIYNDVIVRGPGDELKIYTYPSDVFPPTDFHTATRIGGHVYIIGSVGYMDQRRPGETPVYRLNLENMAIEEIETTGANPGWIGKHEAEYITSDNEIMIAGGSECVAGEDGLDFKVAEYDYVLSLADMTWSCAG